MISSFKSGSKIKLKTIAVESKFMITTLKTNIEGSVFPLFFQLNEIYHVISGLATRNFLITRSRRLLMKLVELEGSIRT